jgi:hypothetical protein
MLVQHRLTHVLIAFVALLVSACDVEFDAGSPPPPITAGSTVHGLIEWDPSQATTQNILFVPDTSYGDLAVQANLQAFFDDIEEVIEEGYWQNNAYYRNLGRFNYYYITVAGSAAAPTTGICPNVTWPAQVDTDGAFADLVLLLHTNTLRDCRWGRKATSEPTSYRTVVHESTHALFNIPDEYCCDGGYYVAQPVLYSSSANCNGDAANAAWRNCSSFTANSGTTWWRSEDSISDIMVAGGSVVVEAGQADWAIMNSVLLALGGSTSTPTVFAPASWDHTP